MIDFTYEVRAPKKGDTVTSATGFKKYDVLGKEQDFMLDDIVFAAFKRFNTLMYVHKVSTDGQYIQVRTKKGAQGKLVETFFL